VVVALGGGSFGGPSPALAPPPEMNEPRNVRGSQFGGLAIEDKRFQGRIMNRYGGGPTGGNTLYNINEFAPENVYAGGQVTRNPNPMTIDSQSGYVEPNIQGAGFGAFLPPGTPGTKYDPIFGGSSGGKGKKWRKKATAAGWTDGTGMAGPNTIKADPPESDIDTTQGTDFNFQTDPGYQFRFEEGQRALDRGAAQRGGLLSGGYARKAMRYGQGFASNEYTNVYNRIANIAGMGQVANQQAGNYAAGARGVNSAYGDIGSGNAWQQGAQNIAALPWGDYFGGGGGGAATQQPYYPSYDGYGPN